MIIRQEEESDRRLQHKQNELALLREFAEASFQEACVSGLDTILQPHDTVAYKTVPMFGMLRLIGL